jgi:4-hydroxy-4-methyl-2-oxoglutarate aldolase
MKTKKFDGLADFDRVPPDLVTLAATFQAAVLCDVAGRRGALDCRIQSLNPGMRLTGPAFTVECRPGDNLMFHVALALAKPGDVIVADGRAYGASALFGELMVTQAVAAGLGGFVVDGAARDVAVIGHGDFPVFSAGRNPAGPTKNIGGCIGTNISVAGVSVSPGDLIVGDADGVVAIPRADVPSVLKAAAVKLDAEATRIREIEEGILVSPWLDQALRDAGVIGREETLL